MTAESTRHSALAQWLERVLETPVMITLMALLNGGGIQENWTIEALVDGKPRAFVLRKDAPATIDASHSRRDEFAIIQAVFAAGVTVPEPVGFCDDVSILGGPFAVMAKVSGLGLGPKVVKTTTEAERAALTHQLAREMARIHGMTPASSDTALTCLGKPADDFAIAEITRLRDWLDGLGLARPGLEWALRWCELHIPKPRETTLIHRDFRTGNYMADKGRLTAVLDWEFACWGDPMFDIGWFMAECWRFSRPDLEAGGIGLRADFYAAYERDSGRTINDAAVRAYEVLAHCRWAIIALQQGERHTSGREPSLEHALTGKMAEELELTALRLTNPTRWRLRHEPIPSGYLAGYNAGYLA
jgi:aminoglycoside phosphotransferase (APT) family kinase protein